MKVNRLKLLPILSFVPLLMANSPAPMPSEVPYEDINVACEYVGKQGESFKYAFDVTNTGNLYPIPDRGIILKNSSHRFHGLDYESLFTNIVIAPNKTVHMTMNVSEEITLNPATDKWVMEAMDIVDNNVTFSNIKVKAGDDNRYTVSASIKNIGDYYYYSIIELTYDNQVYYVTSSIGGSTAGTLITKENIDLSKLTINKITAYRSSYNTYKGGRIFAIILYVLFFTVVAAILLIPPAIIVPVSIVRYKRRKRNSVNNEIDNNK